MVAINAVVEFLPLGLGVALVLAGVLFVRIGRERRRRAQAGLADVSGGSGWQSLRAADRRLAIATLGMWCGPVLGIFALTQVMAWQARREVASFLDPVATDAAVTVDGRPRADGQQVVKALRSLGPVMAHHSHPTNRIDVRIESGGHSLELVLGRDSQVPDEYWIFYPRYSNLDRNEIGRLSSRLFDGE